MPTNLLAICRVAEELTIKRVKVTAEVQRQLEGIFIQQEQNFRSGTTEEIEFDGGWTPEPNELLFIAGTDESNSIYEAAKKDVVSMPSIDAKKFDQAGIRALAVFVSSHGKDRLLLQEFLPRQSLERKFSLVLEGDTFGRLSKPAFSIGSALADILEDDRIKFRLFSRIKIVFDLTDTYREATDAEVDKFCELQRISVADHDVFKARADQKMRKLVHAIIKRQTLNNYTANQIKTAAETQGFSVDVRNHKVIMPTEKANAKALLHFLDDGLYKAALTGDIFITNSKRRHKVS